MKEYLNSILFSDEHVEKFLAKFEKKFGVQLEHYFDSWMNEKHLPAFVISNVECNEILDSDVTRYQIIFDIKN